MEWYYYGRGTKKEMQPIINDLHRRKYKTKIKDAGGKYPCCVYVNKPIRSPAGGEWHELFQEKGYTPPKRFVD